MKLKTALIIACIACLFGSAHYNDHISVSVTLPSPAEVVNAVSKAAEELKESSDRPGISIAFIENGQSCDPIVTEELYRVRPDWNDYGNQTGAYQNLENAISNCPAGYYVFNAAGEIVYPPQI